MRFCRNASAQDIRRYSNAIARKVKARLKDQTISEWSATYMSGQTSDECISLSIRFEHHCVLCDHQLVLRVKESRTVVLVYRCDCLRNYQHGPSLDYLVAAFQWQRKLFLLLDHRVQRVLYPVLHSGLHCGGHQKKEIRQASLVLIYYYY